tara:strand:- start:302 stop:652 length:351 start_codon:yes stop_codon:yes gene_type:complete
MIVLYVNVDHFSAILRLVGRRTGVVSLGAGILRPKGIPRDRDSPSLRTSAIGPKNRSTRGVAGHNLIRVALYMPRGFFVDVIPDLLNLLSLAPNFCFASPCRAGQDQTEGSDDKDA